MALRKPWMRDSEVEYSKAEGDMTGRLSHAASTIVGKNGTKPLVRAKQYLAEKFESPEVLDLLFNVAIERMRRGEKDGPAFVADILGLRGTKENLAQLLAERYGLKSEAELDALVATVKEVQTLTSEQKAERCATYLASYRRLKPDRMKELQRIIDGTGSAVEVATEEVILPWEEAK